MTTPAPPDRGDQTHNPTPYENFGVCFYNGTAIPNGEWQFVNEFVGGATEYGFLHCAPVGYVEQPEPAPEPQPEPVVVVDTATPQQTEFGDLPATGNGSAVILFAAVMLLMGGVFLWIIGRADEVANRCDDTYDDNVPPWDTESMNRWRDSAWGGEL